MHGDLKGVRSKENSSLPPLITNFAKDNILIDEKHRARLADFGLLTILSDPANPVTPSPNPVGAGTIRWMSPELLDPEQFGLKDGRPTKESDSYALGMVILEVLSGHFPYERFAEAVVIRMVTGGELPERPNRPGFTDDMWRTLELCWSFQPEDRPTVDTVLEHLEHASKAWDPSPFDAGDDAETDMAESSSTTSGSGAHSPFLPWTCTQTMPYQFKRFLRTANRHLSYFLFYFSFSSVHFSPYSLYR